MRYCSELTFSNTSLSSADRDLCGSQDFNAFNNDGGSAESWLVSYTKQLRTKLPQGQYILTHARGFLS